MVRVISVQIVQYLYSTGEMLQVSTDLLIGINRIFYSYLEVPSKSSVCDAGR